jgi:hypothetical protein
MRRTPALRASRCTSVYVGSLLSMKHVGDGIKKTASFPAFAGAGSEVPRDPRDGPQGRPSGGRPRRTQGVPPDTAFLLSLAAPSPWHRRRSTFSAGQTGGFATNGQKDNAEPEEMPRIIAPIPTTTPSKSG